MSTFSHLHFAGRDSRGHVTSSFKVKRITACVLHITEWKNLHIVINYHFFLAKKCHGNVAYDSWQWLQEEGGIENV